LLAAAATALARPVGPPVNPRLQPGAAVVVREDGFAARAAVTVGLVGDHLLGTLTADAHGRVAYHFAVPGDIRSGQHALVFAGAPAHLRAASGAGNADVAVPLVRNWPFRTPGGAPSSGSTGASGGTSAPASGPGAPGASGSSGAGAGHGTRGGGTSSTGTDALAGLVIGLAALVAGGALVLTTRRRRPTPRRG